MDCDAIRPLVRQFLDDLLDEKDYEEIQSHLSSCGKCRQYASSVGTLSYRMHEMGQTAVPPDMISTILYQLKKTPAKAENSPAAVFPQFPEAAGSGAFNAQTRPFWIAVFALGAVSIAATAAAFFWKSQSAPAFTPSAKPADPAAFVLSPPPERMHERHFHLTLSGRPELAALIIELQLALERDSERSLVFFVPAEKSALFVERLAAFSGVVKEFGEPPAAAEDERVTVFFE